MEKFIISFLTAFLLLSCSTTQKVGETRTERVYVNHTDTLQNYDSIYIHDSVFSFVKGDTVYLNKIHVNYKYKYLNRYVYRDSVRTDSVRVPQYIEKNLSKWQTNCLKLGKISLVIIIGLIICLIIKLIIKIRKGVFL